MTLKHEAKRPWKFTVFIILLFLLSFGLIHCTHEQATLPATHLQSVPAVNLRPLIETSMHTDEYTPFVVQKASEALPASAAPRIEIDISRQELYLYQGDHLLETYPVSTSKYGIGSQAGSNKTPLGRHAIAQKIGAGAPEGTIFKGRVNTGRLVRIDQERDDIVSSRILWLKGLEAGKNQGHGIDSYQRYIYIHGTAEESKIGRPASHGCIRMYNHDVIELFTQVEEGTQVDILCSQQDPRSQKCLYTTPTDVSS